MASEHESDRSSGPALAGGSGLADRDLAVANWGDEGFFFTEAARGGPLAWRFGASKLEGDALGPVRHAHDNAAEYYFMFSGSAHVETGGHEFVLGEGELGYIPPEAPHNFLGPAGEKDACLFCVIVPNLAENKWRLENFRPGSESLRMQVARPFHDDELPGDAKLAARAIEFSGTEEPIDLTPIDFEVVYLVVAGTVNVSLALGLRGPLATGSYLHLRAGMAHEIAPLGPSQLLRIDCGFDAWKGVPLRPDEGG